MKNQEIVKNIIFNNCNYQNAYFRLENKKKIAFKIIDNVVYVINNGFEEGGNIWLDLKKRKEMFSFTEINDKLYHNLPKIQNLKKQESTLNIQNQHIGNYCEFNNVAETFNINEVVDVFKEYICLLKSIDPRIINVLCQYKEEYVKKSFYNNMGMSVVHDSIDIAFYIKIAFVINNERFVDTFYDGSSKDREVIYNREEDLRKFVNNTLSIITLKSYKIPANNFKMFILDQEVTGTLIHEVIGHLSEADSIENFNHIKRGKRLGSSEITVYDEPLLGARGYERFDDEGTLSIRQPLIDRGSIVGRMNTIQTGLVHCEKSCGNARSISYLHAPICRMRHTSMEGGRNDIEDIISSCKNAIYLVGSRGGTSGINFSISSKYGIIIEHGKRIGVAQYPYLQGNVYKVLKGIRLLCNDKKNINFYSGCGKDEQYPLAVSFSAPSIFIEEGFDSNE